MKKEIIIDQKKISIEPIFEKSSVSFFVNKKKYTFATNGKKLLLEGKSFDVNVFNTPKGLHLFIDGQDYFIEEVYETSKNEIESSGIYKSPMPGNVLKISVKKGDLVKAGDVLITLEAMKMEHTIKADKKGKVKNIDIKLNDNVTEGQVLIVVS